MYLINRMASVSRKQGGWTVYLFPTRIDDAWPKYFIADPTVFSTDRHMHRSYR